MDSNKGPFHYLFINLTQECDANVKFISDIFNDLCVYIPDGKTFKKIRTVDVYHNIKLVHHGFNKIDKTSIGMQLYFDHCRSHMNSLRETRIHEA